MYHRGDSHPEKQHWIDKGLHKYPGTRYEQISLSKLLITSQISPLGLVKITTWIPPRVEKNKYGEYSVIDGRHRLFEFYLTHFPLPHNIKVGCLVVDDPKGKHYTGLPVWKVAQKLHLEPRRSVGRKFFNYFGLFRKNYNYFDVQNHKGLSRKSVMLLQAAEDKLDALYKDFIARICEFRGLLETDISKKDAQQIKKKLALYEPLLKELVAEGKSEDSLLHKLAASLKEDVKKSHQAKKLLHQIQGHKDTHGLIKLFQQQLLVIETGKIRHPKQFEKILLEDLKHADKLLKIKRATLYSQAHDLLSAARY
jgi:hypothetical protein